MALALAVNLVVLATEVPLTKSGGVYELPATLNEMLTLRFVVDSGAAEVVVPVEAVMILLKAGTVTERDFLPGATYVLADGSRIKSPRFLIRRLQVGDRVIKDVKATIGKKGSSLLLGQSCLEKLPNWRLDTTREVFVFGESGGKSATLAASEAFCLQAACNGRLISASDLTARGAYETELTYNPRAAYRIAKELFQAKSLAEGVIKDVSEVTCLDASVEQGLKRCQTCATAQLAEVDKRIAFYTNTTTSSWGEINALRSTANQSLMLSLEAVAKNFASPKNQAAFEKWKSENPVEAQMSTSSALEHMSMSPGQRILGIGLKESDGCLTVTELSPNSPNLGSGLYPGDKITTINTRRVSTLSELKLALNASVGNSVSVELIRPPDSHLQRDLKVGRYAPWNKKFYRKIAIAPIQNESISSDVSGYRNLVYSHLLGKVPTDLYFAANLPTNEAALSLDALRRDGSEYLLRISVQTCEVHSAYRAFRPGNTVRVGEFKATFTLTEVSSGATVWEQELGQELDQVQDVNSTINRCRQTVTEQAVSQIAPKIFGR